MTNEILVWAFYIISFVLGSLAGIFVIKKYARNPLKKFKESGGVDLLISNKEEWNEWRKVNPSWNPNLSNVKLENIDLSGVDMSGVDFTSASLNNVNFDKVNLTNTLFKNAELIKVSLKGAKLDSTIFGGATLTDIIYDDYTIVTNVDLNSAKSISKKIIEELTSTKNNNVNKDYAYFKNNPDELTYISPREFENFVANLLKEKGFEIKNYTSNFDKGYDFEGYMRKDRLDISYCIEVKCYTKTGKVGTVPIQRLDSIKIINGFDKAMVVTNTFFTKTAEAFASENPSIVLIDITKIKEWLSK